MKTHTFGWIQNPSNFQNLKKVVQVFDSESAHYQKLRTESVRNLIPFDDIRHKLQEKLNTSISEFTYKELVGTSKDAQGKPADNRKLAVADALLQITILPQNHKTTRKEWTDNWTADGFLRWAVSFNFVSVDRQTDTFKITQLGQDFSRAKADPQKELSDAEKAIIQQALLKYPPATQVLRILSESEKPLTKFEIGQHLGFKGEKGFTSYNDALMKNWFIHETTENQGKIKSDIEGTSDKYARMICGWLSKADFVKKITKDISTANGIKRGFQEFTLTGRGEHAYRQANGSSRNSRVEKFLMWEFLAIDGSEQNRNYVRTRRGYILKFLKETTSLNVLSSKLRNLGFNDPASVIQNDIKGLNNIGIRIDFDGKNIRLRDNFNDFSIPDLQVTEKLKRDEHSSLKEKLMESTNLPDRFYALVDLGFDGSNSRAFEILTIEFFIEVYGFQGSILGGASKPDGVIYTPNFGVIIDTKAYTNGYSKNVSQEDEMVRYIMENKNRSVEQNSTEWWTAFDATIPSTNYFFLWVSGKFVKNFPEQLKQTSRRTNFNGGAINVEHLIWGGELVRRGLFSANDLVEKLQNTEIEFDELVFQKEFEMVALEVRPEKRTQIK